MDFEFIFIAVLAFALIILMLSVKKRYLLYNAILGFVFLAIVNMLSAITGIVLGFGVYTVFSSVVLGVPAVVAMILIKML